MSDIGIYHQRLATTFGTPFIERQRAKQSNRAGPCRRERLRPPHIEANLCRSRRWLSADIAQGRLLLRPAVCANQIADVPLCWPRPNSTSVAEIRRLHSEPPWRGSMSEIEIYQQLRVQHRHERASRSLFSRPAIANHVGRTQQQGFRVVLSCGTAALASFFCFRRSGVRGGRRALSPQWCMYPRSHVGVTLITVKPSPSV
jgi:hypothetical protein